MTDSDTGSFPDDLRQLQERLHRVQAEYRSHLASLPWSVEPVKGWGRGERYSHRGDVPDSPGWSEEEKETAARLQQELRELAGAVAGHPHWATVPAEKRVAARMDLKKRTRPAPAADEPGTEAA
ncbi:hypothetical protein AB0940_29165 [Streptomyces sp. NPDC006656]|uniref:hypothetical protein n=1 Tax=Streptomyces sp. NPDC006656 TaxID=3156899 RepID=UPI00345374C3